MKTSQCQQCRELQPSYRIKTPGELNRVVKLVQDEVTSGSLIETDPGKPRNEWQTPFSNLLSGPRDDVVLCYFSCTGCNRLYCLSCETYHGSGGSWEVVSEELPQ